MYVLKLIGGLTLSVLAFAVLAQAQSVGPYNAPAPGLFSDQMNQMQTLSNSTDLYLQQQQRLWHPQPLYLPPVCQYLTTMARRMREEFRQKQNRIMQITPTRTTRGWSGPSAEVRHLES